MEPLVTVAIAAYNVEKFLKAGMESVFQQTYKNIEIILVDDGSTDNTPALCDKIAKQDERIRVFHKENGGLGSARNVGIDNAKGDFLYFFDLDDSIESNLIEENVKVAQNKNADLIIFGYYARYSNKNTEELISLPEYEIHSNAELKKVYAENLLWLKHGNGFAWNKFYRMEFLKKHNFHFGNQRIQQDEPFNMQLYLKLDNVYVCPKAYYHYVIYTSGNAGSRYLPDKGDIIADVYHRFMEFYLSWGLNDDRILSYIQHRYISGMFSVVTENYYHEKCPLDKVERMRKIKKVLLDKELALILQSTKIRYERNPVNFIQAWAFNHRKIKILIFVTEFKIRLKQVFVED